MNFDEIIVKESPGLCRCCLSEGCYKDLGSEYTWMNDREVYADMLLDCFDIGITQHSDGPNGAKRLICEVCITRLRDACNFKKQVLDSEKRFIDMLGRGEFRSKMLLYQPQNQEMKTEIVEPEAPDADLTDVEYLEDIDFGDEDEIKTEDVQSTSMPTTSEVPDTPKLKRGRPKKEEEKSEKPSKVVKKPKVSKGNELKESVRIFLKARENSHGKEPPIKIALKPKSKGQYIFFQKVPPKPKREVIITRKKTITPDYEKVKERENVQEESKEVIYNQEEFKEVVCDQEELKLDLHLDKDTEAEPSLSATQQNRFMKRNAYTILQNSTAIPFKWHKRTYICFFCNEDSKNIDLLKQHTRNEHSYSRIYEAVSLLKGDDKVKIDISESECKLCDHKITDLNSFIKHLKEEHNKDFCEGELGVVPYRVGNGVYQCAVCDENFECFVNLKHHMNGHFGIHMCELCGKSFLSELRLRCHSLTHGSKFNCTICNELFSTRIMKINHDLFVHNKSKMLKCLHCPETFVSYDKRKHHHNTVHGVESQQFVCILCNKIFINQSRMRSHERRVHLKEKNFSCPYCERQFFSKTSVGQHISTHTGVKVHQCGICLKTYSRRTYLKTHMKTHASPFTSSTIPHDDLNQSEKPKEALLKSNRPVKLFRPGKDLIIPKKAVIKQKDLPTDVIKRNKAQKAVLSKCEPSMTANKLNKLVKQNAIIILQNSTAMPFKWQRQNYLCFFCHLTLKTIDSLKLHMREEHQKPKIKSSVLFLRGDEKVKIDVSDIECRLCEHAIVDLNALIDHLKVDHEIVFNEADYGVVPYRIGGDVYRCGLCDDSFDYFVKLNQHMNEHFGLYFCEVCGKAFLSQSRLRAHSLCHGLKFSCALCNKSFSSKIQKKSHDVKVHNKFKLCKCLYCSEYFNDYNQRKRHHKKVHNVDLQDFKCPVCDKSFINLSRMRAHERLVHLKEKNFACEVCGSEFFCKTSMQKHMVRHTGERVHQCEVCKKSYARKQTLKDHMKIHKKEMLEIS